MALAAPLWLVGLLPWLGVALYLLWGRRKRRDVPFLELWRGPAAVQRAKWKVSTPPAALALALLALLLAILGAAQPGGRWGAGNSSQAIAVVLDRGLTMSARGASDLRFREAMREAAREIDRTFGPDVPIDAYAIPRRTEADPDTAERVGNLDTFVDGLGRMEPTAIDSRAAVRETVRRALAAGAGPVVVVSDVEVGIDDRRVVLVMPQTQARNVGISRLSARLSPRPQVMVRLRNDSPLTSATLEANFGDRAGRPVRRTIALPSAGAERDYFFDAPQMGAIVWANLIAPDDLDADNKAWLVRESAWPRVELSRPAGALSRLAKLYGALHPPGEGSRVVRVVGNADDLGPRDSGIAIGAGGAGAGTVVRPTRVVPHPITDAVRNWASLDLPVSDAKPPADWVTLLAGDERPLVSVREVSGIAGAGTVRQVWAGLGPAGWADRSEYVAFWAAAFDWAGGVGNEAEQYISHPLNSFDASWKPSLVPDGTHDPGTWPGLYQRADGAIRAFNASPPLHMPPAPANPAWRSKLARLRSAGPGYRDLSAIPLLASAGFVLLAAAVCKRATAGRGQVLSR